MVKVYSLGPMVESMRATIMMIRNKEKESLHGQTADCTMEIGSMASSMARESTTHPRAR